MHGFKFDLQDLENNFEKRPFFLKHDLTDSPLFSLEKLIELANRLPSNDLEFNAGDVPVNQLQERPPSHQLNPEATIRKIAECKTWLGLKRIEKVTEYKRVMDGLLDSVQPSIDKIYPGMMERRAFVFITSPNSMVPFHMDPEHSFLLQIRGKKQFTIYDKVDRELVPEIEVERYYIEANRKLELKEEFRERGEIKALSPGDAMHIPICAPHYVQNGDQISVSLSITYYTPEARRRMKIYEINHRLRTLKIQPRPFGELEWRDNVKYKTWKQYDRIKQLVQRA